MKSRSGKTIMLCPFAGGLLTTVAAAAAPAGLRATPTALTATEHARPKRSPARRLAPRSCGVNKAMDMETAFLSQRAVDVGASMWITSDHAPKTYEKPCAFPDTPPYACMLDTRLTPPRC